MQGKARALNLISALFPFPLQQTREEKGFSFTFCQYEKARPAGNVLV